METLVDEELAGITFIRDYVQLLFDGPTLNLYVWPSVATQERVFDETCDDYKNILCRQIGHRIINFEEAGSDKFMLDFDNGVRLTVNWSDPNKRCAEAAALWDGKQFVKIWR